MKMQAELLKGFNEVPTVTWAHTEDGHEECARCQEPLGQAHTHGKIPGGGPRNYPLCKRCRPFRLTSPTVQPWTR